MNIMRTVSAACVALAAAACGGNGGGGMCVAPDGTYDMHISEKNGDCGLGESDVVIALGSSASTSVSCSGTEQPSDDDCKITFDETCPVLDATTQQHTADGHQTGSLTSNEDGSKLSGRLTWHYVFDDGRVCTSTADVTVTKQ